jgi:putative salt-induced outer membrane protein YdiY
MKMYEKSVYRINLLSLLVLPMMLLVTGAPVSADELLMKDGSRLLGTVVKKENGTLEFKTTFAGVIKVQWSEVSELHTDEPVTVMRANDETSTATVIKNTEQATLLESSADEPASSIEPGNLTFINPAPWRLGEGARWTGRMNLVLKSQRGNTDKDEFEVDAELGMRRKHDRFTLNAEYEKDKDAGTVTDQNWTLFNKYDRFFTRQFYYGGVMLLEHDKFADLDLRTSVGPHIGYQFFESTAMNLSADLGILHVDEDFDAAEDNDYEALGWGIKFDRFLVPDRVQFYHRNNGLLDVGDSDSLTINSWTGFRFPLYMGIVASTEAEIEYDGGAPDNVDKTDKTYRVKLGYQW